MGKPRGLCKPLERSIQLEDLATESRARSGSIQDGIGSRRFFAEGKLALDSAECFGLFQTITRFEPGGLGFPVGRDDNDPINPFVDSRFKEQRHFIHDHRPWIFPCSLSSQLALSARNPRVDDSFQHQAFDGISKNDGAECMTIECAIGVQNMPAEPFDDFPPGWLAWLDDFSSQVICVDQHGAQSLEHAGDGGFSCGHTAGESDEEHGDGAYHAKCHLSKKPD